MSLFAQENPERKTVGIVKLETLNDYLDWGAQVVTAFIDENLLSTLDRNLPYYPTNAEDMTAKDLAHWNKQSTLTVLFEFKAADIRRPIEVPDYDTVDYAMHDVQLNGNVRSRVIAAREAHHDSKQAKSLVAIAAYDVKFENAHAAAQIDLQSKARFRVWNKVLASLGNTFRRASSMSTLGDVGHLLGEINTVLHSDLAQDLLATRKLLARGTFEVEGMCQLTSWKYFVNFQAQRLRCLGAPYSEAELVAVFLDGLPAQPFGTFRQQVYNSKETFVQISDRARAYAAISDSKMQLDQLLASHERSAIRPAQQIFAITPATRACNDFARGACARSSCKYSHNAPTSTTVAGNHQPLICSNCNKRGHSVDTCFGIHGFPNGNRGAKGAPKGGKGGGRGTQSERGRGQHGGAHANNNSRSKSYLINAFNNNTTGVPPPEVASWIEAMVEERYKQKYGNEGHDDGDTTNQQHGYMLRVVDVPQSRTYAEFGPQTRTCDAKILNSRVHSANAITMAIGTIREVAISACPDNGSVGANTRAVTPQVLNVSSQGNADVSACILLDGGASIHATNRADLCFDLLPCGATVGGVGGEFVCETKGSLLIVTDSGKNVRLNDVFISALFPLTFISESKLLSKGCSINKAGAAGTVFAKDGSILFTV